MAATREDTIEHDVGIAVNESALVSAGLRKKGQRKDMVEQQRTESNSVHQKRRGSTAGDDREDDYHRGTHANHHPLSFACAP